MRKLVVRFLMLLFVLGMNTTAWASGIRELVGGTEEGAALLEQVEAVLTADPVYHAQLTGLASSTGGGVVYATTTSGDPRGPEYEPGVSNVAVNGTNLAMRGVTDFPVYIFAWAKPAAGYYFLGWSYSDGGTELVSEKIPNPDYNSEDPESEEMIMPHKEEFVSAYDVATTKGDTLFYTIYATFEPYRFAGYTISSSTTTENQIANFTVVCSILGEDPESSDFDDLEIADPTGGTWVAGEKSLDATEGTLTIPVTFTATNTDPGEFTATLKVKTMAGITLNVPLNARTTASGAQAPQAIRLNKSKAQQEAGDLTDLLSHAATDDIIKLNGDYSDAVSINKSITFDLNGYTLSNTLTVGGGNVTLAYSPFGGTISANVSVIAGKLILTGGTINGNVNVSAGATLEQNGASITGNVTNKGTMTTTDGSLTGQLASSGTLTINGGTFTNASGVAVNVTSGTAQIKKGTITGSTYGLQTNGGTTTISKLAVIYGKTKALNGEEGSLVVNSGKFLCPDSLANGTIVFQSAYFQKKKGAVDGEVRGKKLWRNTSGAEYREGYEFFAGDLAAAQVAGVSVCHIGSTSYSKLEDALAYANNTTEQVVIIMDNDYTLPGGYYTLPANATLLIPYNNDQGSPTPIVDRVNMKENEYVTPSEFRTLTLATGVNLDVFGTIEVSGRQFSCGTTYTGAAYGPYGHLHLNKGSKIVLQNASLLRAWGFVTSGNSLETSGEIDVRRGGKVYELFQMGDWGSALEAGSGLLGGSEVFPLNTYFIQNVEVPTKYHPGAKLSSATTVCESKLNVTIMMSADDIQIIGVNYPGHPEQSDKAMFLMDDMADADNTWVRKWYNPTTDQQVYDINSGAHIGQLVIPLVSSPLFPMMAEANLPIVGDALSGLNVPESIVMNSGQYNLPITNNFKLHLLSGTLDFTQNTALLPGSEVEIDKESTLSITQMTGVNSGSLYVYDYRDWGQWAENEYARRVKYAAYWHGEPTTRNVTDPELIGSAKINVHGTFDNQLGFVFTSEHGGNIFSSVEDAGTFIFTTQLTGEWGFDPAYEGAPEYYTINVAQKKSGNITCKPVWLKNEAVDDYVHAGALAAAGYSYCYLDIDGTGAKWTKLEQRGCVTYNAADGKCYIKPQEYVEIAVSDSTWNAEDAVWIVFKGNEDHTFSDAAGAGRLFINLGNPLAPVECQWWEVEQKDNYYHCIHPENDTYYEWWDDPDEVDPQYGAWKEKKFTITWKDKNWGVDDTADKILQTYQVPYGTQAEWLSTNPTRPANIDYTYDFTGWSPALDKVTSDVTYTATYEEKQIKYTVTFVQDGGMEIERHLLARNEMPVCENVPTRTGYILQWEPALAAVTHDTTYVATWLPEPPTEFAIRFVDYDGKTELQSGNVAVGTMPTPPAIVEGKPQKEDKSFGGKPATAEYTYVFDHWSPAVTEVTQAMTYVAVYREEAVTYKIRFFGEDSTTQIGESQWIEYGGYPVIPLYSKPATAQYTYAVNWKNKNIANQSVQTVVNAADYVAVLDSTTNKYTVTLMSNPSGACTLSGAGIYEYDESTSAVTVSVSAINTDYEFRGWYNGTDTVSKATSYSFAIQGDSTLVACFNVSNPDYTITWMSEDGLDTLVQVGQKANTATIFTGAIPTKDATAAKTYTFYGWYTKNNTGDTLNIYKNGMTPKATTDATYYAYFTEKTREHTIYWRNENGTDIEVDHNQPYGATLEYNSATPTKNADAEYSYTFDGWSATQGGAVVPLPATVSGDAAFYAHFSKTPVLPTNLILGASGSADLASADVKKNDLVITSNGINSSELKRADNLTLTGEAIFRLEKNFAAQTWYAVAVPWTVALSGIRDKSGNAFAANSVYVLEFDANAYATADRVGGRTDYWHFLDQNGHDMQPGKLYMIWFRNAQTAVEFHKKAGASIWTTSTSVALADGSNANQSNWNAIANPALYHADLSTGAADGDVLKYNGNDSYVLGSTSNMIVGEPMFVQVSSPATVVAVQIGGASPAPYHRAPETTTEADNRFVVELTQAGQLNDRMIVQTAEEKADTYVIGKDLAKMSLSAQNAQMWINRYDAKLCKNTVALQSESVEYPLHISAPKAGGYVLSASQERGDATLYLTRNGEAIWNLSESDYVLHLENGATAEYGLRLSAKAPQVATGIDEAVVDAQGETKKVLINNQVFIIRGEKVYTIDGQMVK